MNFSQLFPSRYLSQDDFPQPRQFVIAKVTIEEVRQPNGKKNKGVLYFDGGGKPMILNKTNGLVLLKLYGRNPEGWVGKPIEVYADPTVTMAGEVTGGVRVRAPSVVAKPAPAKAKPAAGPQPMTVDQKHQAVVSGFKNARTEAKVKEFADWAADQDFSDTHLDEQSDAYHEALERIQGQMATA